MASLAACMRGLAEVSSRIAILSPAIVPRFPEVFSRRGPSREYSGVLATARKSARSQETPRAESGRHALDFYVGVQESVGSETPIELLARARDSEAMTHTAADVLRIASSLRAEIDAAKAAGDKRISWLPKFPCNCCEFASQVLALPLWRAASTAFRPCWPKRTKACVTCGCPAMD